MIEFLKRLLVSHPYACLLVIGGWVTFSPYVVRQYIEMLRVFNRIGLVSDEFLQGEMSLLTSHARFLLPISVFGGMIIVVAALHWLKSKRSAWSPSKRV